MSEPQRQGAESPTPSLTATVLDDQRQHIVDKEKVSLDKEVENYDDVLQSPAAEDLDAQYGSHPDGGFRAWLVCIGVSDFGFIGVLSTSHLRQSVLGRSLRNIRSCQCVGCRCHTVS